MRRAPPAGIGRRDGGKFPTAGNWPVPAPVLTDLSILDRDLRDCPARWAGKLVNPNSEFPQPGRESQERITAPPRMSTIAQYAMRLWQFSRRPSHLSSGRGAAA